jgi:two-component system response regulator HydG
MREQAFNFLEKPITPKRLQAIVSKAVESVQLRQQNMNLRRRLDERFGFENLIFSSDSMKGVVDRLRRIAPTDAGVLITGETGTGKDVVAQAIHENSPRKKKPFVAINTAAVAEHLVESELFGHVKGAFTDAISDRQGKFEYANGGTLFLDEVGDMPMQTQIKLLRVLEEREITRVGDNKPIKVNVRVLAATNKDLEKEVEEGRFRSDLYFRLKIVSVHLDPLSQRRDDFRWPTTFANKPTRNMDEKSKAILQKSAVGCLNFIGKATSGNLRTSLKAWSSWTSIICWTWMTFRRICSLAKAQQPTATQALGRLPVN